MPPSLTPALSPVAYLQNQRGQKTCTGDLLPASVVHDGGLLESACTCADGCKFIFQYN